LCHMRKGEDKVRQNCRSCQYITVMHLLTSHVASCVLPLCHKGHQVRAKVDAPHIREQLPCHTEEAFRSTQELFIQCDTVDEPPVLA
jgi:hypothetical protein